eukprot:s1005_g4.t1
MQCRALKLSPVSIALIVCTALCGQTSLWNPSRTGTEPDSDPESLAQDHPGILEFQNIMLQEVCWFHRSAAICFEAPDRRTSSARIAAMRRQQHNMEADDVLQLSLPRLTMEPAAHLQQDYQYMSTALRRPLPRNDRQWIRTTVMQEDILTRQQVSQAICLLLVRVFSKQLADPTAAKARHFARLATDMVKPLLYQPMLLALWPLLSAEAQGKMQNWYTQYERHKRLHPDVPEFLVDPNFLDNVAYDIQLLWFAETVDFGELRNQPQYAYLVGRQTLDAIDRVFSHCHRTRNAVANLRSSPFDVPHKSRVPLRGGVQLSLDLSKAFDRLPRSKLEEALRRINVHPDQIQLILYIHYEMLLVFCKNEYTSEIHTNSGIRQGCGLAPLLWTAYTLLTLEKLEAFLSRDQLTAFADDYHVSWEIESLLQFNNCCVQIGRIIDVLTDLGMQISTDKTAILLLLGGGGVPGSLDSLDSLNSQGANGNGRLDAVQKGHPSNGDGGGGGGGRPPTKWSRPGGKGEGHGEQDRDKETDKHHIQEDDPQETRPSRVRLPSRTRDKDSRPSSRSQRDEDNRWKGWGGWGRRDRMDDKELRELMKELCRLVLRQADTVAYLQMDLGFMLFLKTSMKPKLPVEEETTKQWAIVNNLYKTAQAWHAKKSSDPDSLTNTLRTTLVYCMMTTLQERITALETSQEDVRRLESLGIMENGCFLYMRWNQERKCHEKTQQEHLTLAQAKEHEAVIVKHLVFPRVVLRFHALRKLTSEMASEVRDPQQVLGVPTHLFSIRAPRFQFGDAPHRGQPSSKQAGTVPSGESHRRSGVQAVVDEATVKAIKLGNTQDFCYANACLLAEAGCVICGKSHRGVTQYTPGLPGDSKTRPSFCRALAVSRKLINHALHTEWEARPQPPEYGLPSEVIDAGNVLPLPLSAQLAPGDGASPVTLQCLVNQWPHQAQRGQEVYFAAAERPPPVLLLQVARFNSTGHKLSDLVGQ